MKSTVPYRMVLQKHGHTVKLQKSTNMWHQSKVWSSFTKESKEWKVQRCCSSYSSERRTRLSRGRSSQDGASSGMRTAFAAKRRSPSWWIFCSERRFVTCMFTLLNTILCLPFFPIFHLTFLHAAAISQFILLIFPVIFFSLILFSF